MIGSFGQRIFETSDQKVLTPSDFSREGTARIEEHPRIGKKPLSVGMGSELERVSFTLHINAGLGVIPKDEIAAWWEMMNKGESAPLIIGGAVKGSDEFIIADISEEWNTVWKDGKLYSANLSISLQEYITKA